jgi:iron complex transport system substrate-binding protein
MAPSAAEILADLGASPAVVGVGDFVTWPPELRDRPRLGAYDAPSVEAVLALHADLYVTARSRAGGAAHHRLRALGVEVLELETGTYDGVLEAIVTLGERVGRGDLARRRAAAIRAAVDDVRRRAAVAPPRRVLVVVGREPLFAAGPGSPHDELLRAAGGRNVAADAGSPFPLLSLEAALRGRPEVIVDAADNRPGAARGRAAGDWARWPFLPAVAADRVYQVDPWRISIPGPRLAAMARLFARMIHPEIFGAVEPAELAPPAEVAPAP